MVFDVEVDIAVVGGGGGGLVAALSAAETGAEVALLEKCDRLGGNTSLSSGSVPGAGTKFQRAAGIDDDWRRLADDIMRKTEGTAPRDLVETLARESAPLVEWLADRAGTPIELISDLRKVGHSVPRMHAPPGRQGHVLVSVLETAAQAAGVTISAGNPVSGLISDPADGGVHGVFVDHEAGRYSVGAKKVILAANGFGANRSMLRAYIPEISEAPYFGHQENQGEAIEWAAGLGAGLVNMGAFQGHASVAYPSGALLSWAVIERGGILVNARGDRFIDESLGYSGCAQAVLSQDGGKAFAVFDKATYDYLAEKALDFQDIMRFGGVVSGGNAKELALKTGFDLARFKETLATWNGVSLGDQMDPLGRENAGLSSLDGPLYAVKVTAGLFHTQGGVDVDARARVRRADGSVIGNLYAVGGVAVGLSGRHGGRGYCSANGLLAALGLGRIAGRDAGDSVMAERKRKSA
ncbi:MAG: FAD-dependent oxidoreductase [Alphaproteobacteria bacterium]|nr:FAD-dependent oxidoreductase [Alphaproteobacteria bacterium]